MTETTPMACPVCGGTNITIVRESLTENVRGGGTVSFLDESSKCDRCGEEFYTVEQSLASSRAYAAAVRAANRLVSPEQIRAARLALGMTQPEFEAALGVGKKTVIRWERGTVAPSMAANGLLWIAVNFPAIFKEYARTRTGQVEAEGMEQNVIAVFAPVENAPPVVVKLKQGVSYSVSERTSGEHALLGQT
jgi:HTH-type transcriptional regulator / antitoxin MqsA